MRSWSNVIFWTLPSCKLVCFIQSYYNNIVSYKTYILQLLLNNNYDIICFCFHLQYCILQNLYGYGSIPINTIFRGMNIQLNQLFWCSPGVQGFDTLPYSVSPICLEGLLRQSSLIRSEKISVLSISWPAQQGHNATKQHFVRLCALWQLSSHCYGKSSLLFIVDITITRLLLLLQPSLQFNWWSLNWWL
jgi:hypothetical protein